MTNFKLRGVLAAVAGTLVLGMATSAMADATFDLVDALVKKGVLTEEEALPLLQGRENDIKAADKKVKKGRVAVSDAIDNATAYGDLRVRSEYRKGGVALGAVESEEERTRGRYKITFGVKTESGDFYSDLAFAMGAGGRSDNATFGSSNGANNKEALLVKRAMVGWNVNNWLAVEAGRIANPLYTTEMVWDKDLTLEGLAEKINYSYNKFDFFGNFVQSQYKGDYKNYSNVTGGSDAFTNNLLAFQGGVKYPFTDTITGKAAITYTTYSGAKASGTGGVIGAPFVPGLKGATAFSSTATNDLRTIEIPAEIEFKSAGFLSYKVFGDFVYNTASDDRYAKAVANATAGATRNAISAAGNDDTAWLLGVGVKSAQAKDVKQGDWEARLWWQDVGVYALDQNAVDSDFMDSRINMKGIVLKAQYSLRDNVALNFAAGSATRKNNALATVGTASDLGASSTTALDLNKYQLYQLDLTYKF